MKFLQLIVLSYQIIAIQCQLNTSLNDSSIGHELNSKNQQAHSQTVHLRENTLVGDDDRRLVSIGSFVFHIESDDIVTGISEYEPVSLSSDSIASVNSSSLSHSSMSNLTHNNDLPSFPKVNETLANKQVHECVRCDDIFHWKHIENCFYGGSLVKEDLAILIDPAYNGSDVNDSKTNGKLTFLVTNSSSNPMHDAFSHRTSSNSETVEDKNSTFVNRENLNLSSRISNHSEVNNTSAVVLNTTFSTTITAAGPIASSQQNTNRCEQVSNETQLRYNQKDAITKLKRRRLIKKRSHFHLNVQTWPNGRVSKRRTNHYSSYTQTKRKEILRSMRVWSSALRNRIRFTPRNGTFDTDYLLIFQITGQNSCFSAVGRMGGKQPLHIGSKCFLPEIVHELGHVLGLLHEHQRKDRDTYIRIQTSNINKSFTSAFKKVFKTFTSKEYDFKSIMHYRDTAFSINGKPTMVSLNRNNPLPKVNPSTISTLDIQSLQLLYKFQ